MSAHAEVWKPTGLDEGVSTAKSNAAAPRPLDPKAAAQLAFLVNQVFLSDNTTRRQVLFMAADEQTTIGDLCEQTALVLAQLSGAHVALICGEPPMATVANAWDTQPRFWRAESSVVHEGVWRLPSWIYERRAGGTTVRDEVQRSFKYFLFAATAASIDLPLFANACDGCVLVVTASRTRREAAVHARNLLQRYGVPLLGTVLTERTFAIPESIYRRL